MRADEPGLREAELQEAEGEDEADTGRLEAFSDGVFAVAITLLALDLHVPTTVELKQQVDLLGALVHQWPVYVAYTISFAFILIMWINHHGMFKLIRRSDHLLLIFNGLLLLFIVAVPFSTSLLAQYLSSTPQYLPSTPQYPSSSYARDQHVAAAVFSGIYLLIALLYNAVWRYAAHNRRLIGRSVHQHRVDTLTQGYHVGPALYLIAFLLAFVSVPACVAANVALAGYFALPHFHWRRRKTA